MWRHSCGVIGEASGPPCLVGAYLVLDTDALLQADPSSTRSCTHPRINCFCSEVNAEAAAGAISNVAAANGIAAPGSSTERLFRTARP